MAQRNNLPYVLITDACACSLLIHFKWFCHWTFLTSLNFYEMMWSFLLTLLKRVWLKTANLQVSSINIIIFYIYKFRWVILVEQVQLIASILMLFNHFILCFFCHEINGDSVLMCLSNHELIKDSFVRFIFTFTHLFKAFFNDLLCKNIKLIITTISNMIIFCRFLQYKLTHFVDKGRLPAFE